MRYMKRRHKTAGVKMLGKVCMESHNNVNAAEYIVCSVMHKARQSRHILRLDIFCVSCIFHISHFPPLQFCATSQFHFPHFQRPHVKQQRVASQHYYILTGRVHASRKVLNISCHAPIKSREFTRN